MTCRKVSRQACAKGKPSNTVALKIQRSTSTITRRDLPQSQPPSLRKRKAE
uniref:Uncharacterized protein n=1 Tax=Myoviridae sp. ctKkB1 TaxID=2825081 RepID=A0A8S5V4I2_9CAUD|nr:MAG TPA: hypothetical protein [Myoviridae sp. ctKkB1]